MAQTPKSKRTSVGRRTPQHEGEEERRGEGEDGKDDLPEERMATEGAEVDEGPSGGGGDGQVPPDDDIDNAQCESFNCQLVAGSVVTCSRRGSRSPPRPNT